MNGKITRNPIAMAEDESLSITFIDPTRPDEMISHNLIAGGFYGIGIDAGRIPGETIETSSDRYSQAYKTESLYVNGLLNERIMGEALYFSSINWLYQTDAAERIAESLAQVVSTRQAEMLAELSLQRDWLFGMPERVNITGVRVDAGRDTSVVNPIDGDNTKIKKYMTLTLYNGSVNEHLDLDIPLGTNTAVSAIKAIQISHQQGIPIHHITSTNINSILPILQVGSDVKTNIQDSVNAGYEVTVPEREITYAGWQGTGYIIQDPITGAGACMITGGAAGAQMLAAIGTVVYEIIKFMENRALIVEGDTSWIFEVGFPFPELAGLIIAGATFLWGYLPIYKWISTTEGFLTNIANPKHKILYFMGHGNESELCLYGGKERVTKTQIAGSSTSFVYVHLDACNSAGVTGYFNTQASLGYSSYYASAVDFLFFDVPYLLCLCKGDFMEDAKNYALFNYSIPQVVSIRKFVLQKWLGTSDNFKPEISGNRILVR